MTSLDDFYRILVTSSALEEGLDYLNIRLIIYKDIAYSFIGFLQGSSQGGRDSQLSTSMFFYNSTRLESSNTSTTSSLAIDKSLIYSYLKEQIYQRRQISLYLDSIILDECSNTMIPCDLCFNRTSIKNKQVTCVLYSNKEVEE